MSVELVAVLVAVVAVGFTTTAAVLTGFRRLNDWIDAGLAEATRERAEIRERLAHLDRDARRAPFLLRASTARRRRRLMLPRVPDPHSQAMTSAGT